MIRSISLNSEQRARLLEMCRHFHPEAAGISFNHEQAVMFKYETPDRPHYYTWTKVHWYELCDTVLRPAIERALESKIQPEPGNIVNTLYNYFELLPVEV